MNGFDYRPALSVSATPAQGMNPAAIRTPSMHPWMVWRDNLSNFAPLLFQSGWGRRQHQDAIVAGISDIQVAVTVHGASVRQI